MAKPSWLDKLANRLGYVKQVALSTLGALGLESWPFFKTKDYLEHYTSWVFACAKARATDVAALKLHLFKIKNREEGEVEEVVDHEVLSLLRSVNPFMTTLDLFEHTQAYKDLAGEAFWYLIRAGQNEKSKIIQIWLLRPDWMTIETNKEKFITGYVYKVPGQGDFKIPRNDIVHFKEFNPTDPYRGMSVIRAAAKTIDIDDFSEEYNRRFFLNSARPDVVLRTEQKLDDAIVKRMRAQWDNEYRGTEKAYRMAILEGGLDIKPYSVSQKDMQFLESQRFNRDKIMALFQVPKTVLGIVEDVNRANAEVSDLVFAKRVVEPAMRKIVATLNESLVSQYKDGSELFFDFDSPVPENTELKLKKHDTLFKLGAMTPNEIRQENGLDEVNGLDSFYVPINMVPVSGEDTAGNEEPVKHTRAGRIFKRIPAMTVKEKITEEITDKTTKAVMEAVRKDLEIKEEELRLEPSTMPYEIQEQLWKQFVQKAEATEKRYITELRKFFARQRDETLERFNEATKAIDRRDVNRILFNLAKENKVGADIFIPILLEFLEEAGSDALDALGLDEQVFDTTAASVREWRNAEALKGIKATNRTTRTQLRRVLSRGVTEGLPNEEIAKLIQGVFGEADKVRALRIARTETIRAGNRGALEAYKQSGVVAGKQWFTALDERVCEWCNPMHGRIKSLDAPYFYQGESFTGKEGGVIHLDFSDVDVPPLHPNCRCTLIPITRR